MSIAALSAGVMLSSGSVGVCGLLVVWCVCCSVLFHEERGDESLVLLMPLPIGLLKT